MILFSLFLHRLRLSESGSCAGIPDTSMHRGVRTTSQPGARMGFLQRSGLLAASSRPHFPPGVGWESFGTTVCCFMPGDDLGQKCWNDLKGTFSTSLTLCSGKMLAELPVTARPVGQSQELSGLQGSGCGQQGDAITAGFSVSCGRLLSTPAEGSGKHRLSRKKKK